MICDACKTNERLKVTGPSQYFNPPFAVHCIECPCYKEESRYICSISGAYSRKTAEAWLNSKTGKVNESS